VRQRWLPGCRHFQRLRIFPRSSGFFRYPAGIDDIDEVQRQPNFEARARAQRIASFEAALKSVATRIFSNTGCPSISTSRRHGSGRGASAPQRPSLFGRGPIDAPPEDVEQIRDGDDPHEPFSGDHGQRSFGATPHQVRRLTNGGLGRPRYDVPGHGVLDFRDAFRLSGLQRGVGQDPHDLTTIDDDKMVETAQAHTSLCPLQRFRRPNGFDRRAHDVFESHIELLRRIAQEIGVIWSWCHGRTLQVPTVADCHS
jgi:hypothetical protein